jgi:hypothetical protein
VTSKQVLLFLLAHIDNWEQLSVGAREKVIAATRKAIALERVRLGLEDSHGER